ncbi:MAG: phage protease [Opitutaceae bacterium]|jgi:phage I-like protein|nr:phage protease [Opitutaceae bacterium]
MKYVLFNRFELASDGWIHLSSHGEHWHKQGVQLVLPADVKNIVENWENAGRPKILVDFDHFSHDADKPTAAAGWLVELQARNTGLWGKPQWTDDGAAAVTNGRYRFTSPVWTGTKDELGKFHPDRLLDVALTNKPNLKDLMPISNRDAAPAAPAAPVIPPELTDKLAAAEAEDWKPMLDRLAALATATDDVFAAEAERLRADLPALIQQVYASGKTAAALAAALAETTQSITAGATAPTSETKSNTTPTQTDMKAIATALGLPETATEAEIVSAIGKLKDGKTAAEAEVVENRKKEADAAATQYGIEDAQQRETFTRIYLTNRADALALLGVIKPPAKAAPAAATGKEPLTNREAPQNPATAPGTTPPDRADGAKAAAIRNRANTLRAENPRLTFTQAWTLAEREHPAA